MNLFVLNAGSSSVKFAWYGAAPGPEASGSPPSLALQSGGRIQARDSEHFEIERTGPDGKKSVEPLESGDPEGAMESALARVASGSSPGGRSPGLPDAVGCRVVHGGARFVKPTLVTPGVLDQLRSMKDLAPLHLPGDVRWLERILALFPGVPAVAVFDTDFHRTLPAVAFHYALPEEIAERHGLRRYGFHGLAHAHVSRVLIDRLGRGASPSRIVTCHLGNGASVCAVRDGRSIDVSMGFTPLEGLVMGTRSGDLDPGVVLYLMRAAGMSADQIDDLLNRRSGLLGLSGTSGDVRELEAAAQGGNRPAELALEIFAYRAAKYVGAYAAVLDGLDAIAFSGGIGEHSVSIRERICRRLGSLGVALDDQANRSAGGTGPRRISRDDGRVSVWVVPANEELEIARATYLAIAVRRAAGGGPDDGGLAS
jgi:acetate kinase